MNDIAVYLATIRLTTKQAIRKSFGVTCFYIFIIALLLWLMPEEAWYIRKEGIIVFSLFGLWRYSWQMVHVVRMLRYKRKVFPKLRQAADALENKYPRRLYFVIPSYFEMPEITVHVFNSIMRECINLPCQVTMVLSVGSQAEIQHINKLATTEYDLPNFKIIFMLQKSGKRIALGHGLRAVAREFNRLEDWDEDNENDLVVLMDGDSMLVKGVLAKTLPLFRLKPNLGVLTTNNIAMSVDQHSIFQSWYELKFAQRNHQFHSHSLSERILTATGRFSIYRAPIVVGDEFIRFVEADFLDHWLFGRFRFLMGDDKSTWFYCLKHGYEMLYIPDAHIVAIEGRTQKFFSTSISLMTRWYGNMLRNNMRAIRLGPNVMGKFIWWCIVDQRLTTWTPLVGLVSATMLGIFASPYYLFFYLIWVIFTRLIMLWIYVLQGLHLKVEHLFLLLYGQWVGTGIKLVTMYNLKKQTWGKGKKKETLNSQSSGTFVFVQNSVRYMLITINILLLVLFCGLATNTLSLPPVYFFRGMNMATAQISENPSAKIINSSDFGIRADDELPDDAAINAAVQSAPGDYPVIIKLPPGRLILNAPIILDKSNVSLVGSDNSPTILESRFSRDAGEAAVLIKGSKGKRIGVVSGNSERGDRVLLYDLTSKSPISRSSIKYLWLGTPNTSDFLDKLGSDKWNKQYPWLRQTIIEVDEFGSDFARIKRTLSTAMPAGAEIYAPNMVTNVEVKNLEIIQTVPGFDTAQTNGKYENLVLQYAVDGVRLDWTADCLIENVKISFAGRHPLVLENSYGITMRKLDINGAWNKGPDGNGYVRFARAYFCRLEDSEMQNIRHLAFQWSASDNVVSNCIIGADVNFHGGFSHNNTVVGSRLAPPPWHPWGKVTRMQQGGGVWAPMDGEGNSVDGE